MHVHLRKLWPWAKALLGVAIVAGVAWQFARYLDTPELWEQPLPLRPEWLVASAVLYVLGIGFSAGFWYLLLRILGQAPSFLAACRAYYIAHLGKYVPGKAWALIARATLIAGSGVRPGVAVLTSIYEVLTTMAAGALLAAILLLVEDTKTAALWTAVGLLAAAGIPILPVVFNPLAAALTLRAGRVLRKLKVQPEENGVPSTEAQIEAEKPVPLRSMTLLAGLGMTACGWILLGLSLWAMLEAVLPEPPAWDWGMWLRCTAYVALAYVAGFVFAFAPGGLGVREFALQALLMPEFVKLMGTEQQARGMSVVVVVLLRLLWTLAEVIMAGGLYWLPVRRRDS